MFKRSPSIMSSTAMDSPRDIYWAIEPLYYASRATGLATFRYSSASSVSRGGPRLRTCPLALTYAYLLSGALLTWLCMYVLWALAHGKYGDTRTLAVHMAMRVLVYLCMFASVMTGALVFHKAPREALSAVARADAALWTRGGSRRACARARKWVTAQVAVTGLFFGGYVVIDVLTQAPRHPTTYDWAFHFVPHAAPQIFNVVMGLQYSNWLLLVWSRLRALNRRLKTSNASALTRRPSKLVSNRVFGDAVPSSNGATGSCRKRISATSTPAEAHPTALAALADRLAPPESDACRLRRLQSAHLALCDTATAVDAALGLPILLETCYLASELVSRAYALYRTGLPRHMLWLAVTAVRLTAIAAPAHACGVAAQRTAELLGRASLAPPAAAEGRRALRDFSRQAALLKLRFSAAGIFAVDASLLLKILVVAITYILIAVQFECKQNET